MDPLVFTAEAGTLPFRVVHQDAHCLAIDKPAGMLSVPGRDPALPPSAIAWVQTLWPEARTVHRLDMETSGLLLIALGLPAQQALSRAFEKRHVHKRYEAWVAGTPQDDSGRIELPLRCDWPNRPRQMVCHEHGRPALTHWQVVERGDGRSRVSLEPITGRSHQLRVHLAALGHPILGDSLYADEAARAAAPRLLLHAAELAVPHPASGAPLVLRSAVPF